MANRDLDAAKKEFWDDVDRYAPDLVKPMKPVLDDLIAWSEQHSDVLTFRWHEGEPGKQRQCLVKYCVAAADSPFWAVWPRKKDGAKLTLITDPCSAFTEELRQEASQTLAEMGKHESGDVPEIALQALIPLKNREEIKELMTRLLSSVTGHDE